MAYKARSNKYKGSTKAVDASDLGAEVEEILTVYSHNVTEHIKEATDTVAEDTVQLLKDTSPRENSSFPRYRRKKTVYAEGWEYVNSFDSPLERRDTIHNATDSQLIHLLEWGHVMDGLHFDRTRRAPGHPHFMPAYEKAMEEYDKAVKEAIDNANNDT